MHLVKCDKCGASGLLLTGQLWKCEKCDGKLKSIKILGGQVNCLECGGMIFDEKGQSCKIWESTTPCSIHKPDLSQVYVL